MRICLLPSHGKELDVAPRRLLGMSVTIAGTHFNDGNTSSVTSAVTYRSSPSPARSVQRHSLESMAPFPSQSHMLCLLLTRPLVVETPCKGILSPTDTLWDSHVKGRPRPAETVLDRSSAVRDRHLAIDAVEKAFRASSQSPSTSPPRAA